MKKVCFLERIFQLGISIFVNISATLPSLHGWVLNIQTIHLGSCETQSLWWCIFLHQEMKKVCFLDRIPQLGISIFDISSAIFMLSRGYPVVSGGNRISFVANLFLTPSHWQLS